ncbi:MAG: shikimate dehydrogenase [Bacteroidales bacterium]|nr:shikimate dehydrogenase [Bacteroidales bacterium]
MRLFGLIGFPLSHSFSAKYFAKKFETENIPDADYQLFPLGDISEVTSLIALKRDLQGFNVTIPYKLSILPYLDNISDAAKSVGAVNCVKIERNESGITLTGYNTDVYGFRESLIPALKPFQNKALVLGTGGAAKAVCYTLLELGINYTLVSRTGDKQSFLSYPQLSEKTISDNLLIINTSPVGTFPDTDKCPDIPYQFLGSKHLLFDLIYNPAETKFLKLGREAGAATLNGSKMLELQAEKSWEIWNG